MKYILSILALLLMLGCSNNSTHIEDKTRNVYVLLAPTKAQLTGSERFEIEASLKYIINDLSSGDSLVIDTPGLEKLTLHLSTDPEMAHINRYVFKEEVLARLDTLSTATIDKEYDMYQNLHASLNGSSNALLVVGVGVPFDVSWIGTRKDITVGVGQVLASTIDEVAAYENIITVEKLFDIDKVMHF